VGVGFYIELDKEVSFESYVEGKPLAWVFEELELFCQKHGLKDISDYIYDEDSREMLEHMQEWHSISEGIEWVEKLLFFLEKEKPNFYDEFTMDTLSRILEVFKKAQSENSGIQWHFDLDF